ncbi:CoA transferase [Rhizobium leguminosarum bv. viciae]|uniref:CoA transferase n=1 Tax=Rhizobium leguminosarum bv. viciae TaxID=387 RepID=A0A8I2KIU5_RHILV|nr:CoA transferase [Rhizobium leguminosarum]MBY5419963.1 CoA transferase [Rhizobium leguminosarum]MBY5427110.1 CoA transferase [Rhizobium leguminosarum]MBY5793985.1 CoA transferase [Rhizobium leguminosarum]NKL83645.1 CoA transferase [Rhizobium leguminosarum bv. viciae]NKM48299.1 CoA transferase [Rhizobium leguminosarum bv. viciae]
MSKDMDSSSTASHDGFPAYSIQTINWEKPMALPLEGIRICDLSQIMFGPCGTQVLGDFGADVIKIERPGIGDISRTIDRHRADRNDESANFLGMNRNKRSLALDVKSPEGLAIVKRIAKNSDVFVHNYRPGVIERLGLGYDDLRAENEKLIYVEGSGFGVKGPLAGKGGMDFVAQAIAGVAHGNKDPSGKPQLFPISASDFSSGMILAQGVLLALFHRERTGRGQKIEINLLDVFLVMQQQEVTQKLLTGKDFNPLQQDPMDVFATADGHIAVIAVLRPNPISDICNALEIPDITADPALSTLAKQMANREEYRRRMAEGFAKFATAECERRLDAVDILCSPVLPLGKTLKHPQVQENGILVEISHPKQGKFRTVGNAIKSSEVDQISLVPPPLLGQHSEEVLLEFGYSTGEIEVFKQSNVINK